MSNLVRLSAATVEPVSVATAKAVHRIEDGGDDAYLALLITAARSYAETFCRRSFLTGETWALTLDFFPYAVMRDELYMHSFDWSRFASPAAYFYGRPDRLAIAIPMGPVDAINSITYLDANGATQTVPSNGYFLVADDNANPFVYPTYNTYWPITQPRAGAITVTFTTGGVCPAGVETFILQMVGHWYSNREAVAGALMTQVPLSGMYLLWPHRLLEL